jgi:protein SCO1/2
LFLALGSSVISFAAMRRTVVFEIALLVFTFMFCGCGKEATSEKTARHYETRGVVRGISPDRATVEIQHENIPDFMPSMTMPFLVRDKKEIADLKVGDAISFRLSVTPNDFWIDRVKKVGREEVRIPEPEVKRAGAGNSRRLKEGDVLPAFSLVDQDGNAITAETFRGQPLVLTFVFTRCALPNFCPRMTSHFAELQSLIKAEQGAPSKTHLLSITLDPAFDTPQVLKQYGAHSNQDTKVWTLATGDPKQIDALTQAFSVYRQNEGGTLSHGLATALISPEGKIVKIWRGNAWTTREVIGEIRAQNF